MVHKGSQTSTEAIKNQQNGKTAGKQAQRPATGQNDRINTRHKGQQSNSQTRQTNEKNNPPKHKQHTKSKEHKTPNCSTWNNDEHHNRTITNITIEQ
ncbi:hypothetical protein [Thiolapillus sp.]|uniref:hypothetical protein n=1 Tax=Thiolapillus sp. TaxID=2017437 RepID=UPI003AF4523D